MLTYYLKIAFSILITISFCNPLYSAENNPNKKEEKVFIQHIIVQNITDKKEQKDTNTITQPYLNQLLTIKDFEKIRLKLRAYYKNKGNIFAKVILPSQDLTHATLKFAVIKGKVGTITFTGNQHYSDTFLRKNFDLKEGDYLDYNTMLKSLLLLNEYEDLKVKSYLKKGATFGTSDITLQVKEAKPSHFNVYLDNLGSKQTSEYRMSANLLYGNWLQVGDETQLNATLGLDSINTKLARANYTTTALGNYHTKLNFGFLYADYIVGGDFSVLGIKGDTYIYTLGAQQPILRTTTDKLDLNFNYSKKDIKSYLLGSLSSKDNLNIIDMQLAWQHKRIFDALSINLDTAKGFSGDGSFGSRLNENVDFLKYNLTASYNRYINAKNNILLSINTQYSTDKLPLSEMFILGGLSSVRGFDTAEKLGDKGYTASIEWYYHPHIKNKFFKDSMQLGFFLDHGQAFANNPVPGENKSVTLTGGGVELIANIKKKYFARLCIGIPIRSSVSAINKKIHIYAFFGTKLW